MPEQLEMFPLPPCPDNRRAYYQKMAEAATLMAAAMEIYAQADETLPEDERRGDCRKHRTTYEEIAAGYLKLARR